MGSQGRVAVVTGGARGIGRAICLALARQGADVAIADLNLPAADELAAEIEALGRRALALRVDVSRRDEVREMVGRIVAAWGRLDILVNNAAICPMAPFDQITDEQWARTLAINLQGPFICSQEAVKVMKPQGWGRIIAISSVAGKMGSVRSGADYSASKGGVIALTMCIARTYARSGITANVVAPGTVHTDLNRNWPQEALDDLEQRTPLGYLAEPEDIAAAVAFLASDEARYITGEVLDVNGGFLMD
ncbi:MAG: SDR family oxidoreductase [Chloroflexi bacterium]|nr:SDR family oxidoreductase [Chloroflexota bacterium]